VNTLYSEVNGILVVMPGGRLDGSNGPEIEEVVLGKIDQGSTRIVYDLNKTDYVSSGGLRVILRTAKVLKKDGGEIALCQANEQVLEVLEISGFLGLIKHAGTLEDALEYL